MLHPIDEASAQQFSGCNITYRTMPANSGMEELKFAKLIKSRDISRPTCSLCNLSRNATLEGKATKMLNASNLKGLFGDMSARTCEGIDQVCLSMRKCLVQENTFRQPWYARKVKLCDQ
ncbi:hypothetical protein DPMN_091057 [Dreissena polymorpha]|uniref:Uncharacterized protein n=1 Tax=Dreissena polymorpha TaxID=45954 RepID=A0A9D4KYV4_DREPO|nr:hypothetical protein DPMN_091057 [Dreissena polymorpha]